MEMNVNKQLLSAALIALLMLAGCEDNSALEKAGDKVNDALDRRPGEGVRDAAEDLGDAAKELGGAVKEAAREASAEAKDAAHEAADGMREAAREIKE
jgi:hypothetical protein